LKLVASGLTSMVSPVNLVTIGAIAMGGALVNWLSRSSDKVDDFKDRLDAAHERVKDTTREVEALFRGASSLEELDLMDQVLAARDALDAAEAAAARSGGGHAGRTADLRLRAAQETLEAAQKNLETLRENEEVLRRAPELYQRIVASARAYADERLKAVTGAQDMLTDLQEEKNLRRIALTHGEDSVQYAEAQAAAQRRVFEEMVDALDVSQSLKDEILAAYTEGERLAALDIAGGIWGAADAASQLVNNLANAAVQKAALASVSSSQQSAARSQIMLDTVGQPVERAGRLAVEDVRQSLPDGGYSMISSGSTGRLNALGGLESNVKAEAENAARLQEAARAADAEYRKLQTSLNGGSKSKGSGSKTKAEPDEVAALIQAKQTELDILRESDPVQKELLRMREKLADATTKQREKITELITTQHEEREAQEQAQQTTEFFRSSAYDLTSDLIQGGDAAASAWDRFSQSLKDAALQALLLGEGPLRGIIGALSGGLGGGGGVFGFIGSLLGLKDGGDTGMTYGVGGSRDDRILAFNSAGRPFMKSPMEFVVNADATARHRGLLEAINSGAPLPRFANGGDTGGSSYGGFGGFEFKQEIYNQADVDVRSEQRQTPRGPVQQIYISRIVAQGINQPGGEAERLLMRNGGYRQTGPRR
jgi:hypothetical protein